MRFKDKVAIVTGGGSGIGQATAIAFSREGAKVVVADMSEENGHKTVSEIQAQAGQAIFAHVDVGRSDSVNAMVALAVAEYGQLDIYHSNAGIGGANEPCMKMTDEDWHKAIAINLSGCFYGARAALPHLINTSGNIVMTGSVASVRAGVANVGYHSTKHGLAGLVRQIAVEYASQGVRVNAVLPGGVITSMTTGGQTDPQVDGFIRSVTPLGRWARPEEIADAVLFLASQNASYITGALLPVDGGWTAK